MLLLHNVVQYSNIYIYIYNYSYYNSYVIIIIVMLLLYNAIASLTLCRYYIITRDMRTAHRVHCSCKMINNIAIL